MTDETKAAGYTSEIDVWLVTIDAHCTVIADPDEGDDIGELAGCIKDCVAHIRGILNADDPRAPYPGTSGNGFMADQRASAEGAAGMKPSRNGGIYRPPFSPDSNCDSPSIS